MSSRHYAITNGRVKYHAFMPAKDGQTSVYRIDGLNESNIWMIGENFVAKIRQLQLKARGDVVANAIFEAKLSVIPEQNTHKRHANISGWPREKQKQMLIAQKIAANATLFLNESFPNP